MITDTHLPDLQAHVPADARADGLERVTNAEAGLYPDAAPRSLTSSRGHGPPREPGDGAAGFGLEPWRGQGRLPFALWVVAKPACPLPRAFTTLCYSADGQSILAGGMSKFVCIYHVREQILRKKFEISCNLSLDAMEVSELRGCCRAPWSPELSGLTWRPPQDRKAHV